MALRFHAHCASLLSLLGGLILGGFVTSPSAQASSQALPQSASQDNLRALEARYLDQVMVVVGDQIVTRRDVIGQFQTPKWRDEVQSLRGLPDEQRLAGERQIEIEATAELVEFFLEVRAGQDRGFDPKLVDSLVERRFDDAVQRSGGYRNFHGELQRMGSTPEQYKERVRRTMYRLAWQGAASGRQAGTTGRIEIDTFVRPGELRSNYKSYSNSPRPFERELLGSSEPTFELLELALGFKEIGGRDSTVEQAGALRNRILNGETTFDTLIDRWAQTDPRAREKATLRLTKGQAQVVSQESFGGPAFLDYVSNSKPGQISEVFESPSAAHIFELVRTSPATPVQPFANWDIQEAIRKHLKKKQASTRIGRAHRELIFESQLSDRNLTEFMLDPSWLFRER